MEVVGLILLFAVIITFEVPNLYKNKLWRELTVFSFFLIIGMIYTFGQVLDYRLPNPIVAIEYFFSPPADFIERLLK